MNAKGNDTYARIYALVELIPPGRLATYGQLGRLAGCGARQAGYAMAAAPGRVPWQRVINARGEISRRKGGGGQARQRKMLEAEGVTFDGAGRIDLEARRWPGPGWDWLQAHGYDPAA